MGDGWLFDRSVFSGGGGKKFNFFFSHWGFFAAHWMWVLFT